jgi:hypothetical protein
MLPRIVTKKINILMLRFFFPYFVLDVFVKMLPAVRAEYYVIQRNVTRVKKPNACFEDDLKGNMLPDPN